MSAYSPYRRQRHRSSEINMTPLIDMVFILLIFFIVTTSFVKESGVDVERPVANTAVRKENVSVMVGVDAEGIVWLDGRSMDIRSVRPWMEHFLAETPEGAVMVAADRHAESGVLIQVLDACREAGVKNVSVAARRPK
ncbi:ExbD/TolR family protein [Desulfobaculum bizertense]|uniref:Outer membrane transport energization protein ExbD (TC 2.C.1.1.1) n=1 Tax=Desulfobaculum bizertense DSM 18034 TaxID=1121442 RepID=A0A1T4VRX9_9BACT|nr:biopolymer transporter ExbD [Desulfobaculum bizertense]UIJ38361.1 biopolymer transporter ExbD [Desulfobaculum bizertense]SKA67679.1 outer membrane transport energization protein ExbD (TC 2.C.1.1.1) [Desulfobaculum bizertense DSM 18034]